MLSTGALIPGRAASQYVVIGYCHYLEDLRLVSLFNGQSSRVSSGGCAPSARDLPTKPRREPYVSCCRSRIWVGKLSPHCFDASERATFGTTVVSSSFVLGGKSDLRRSLLWLLPQSVTS